MTDLIDKARVLAKAREHMDMHNGNDMNSYRACLGLHDALSALPAQGVMGCEAGYFATAAIDFVHEMEARGFSCAAGQSDDDDLDFSIAVYRGKDVVGCVSLHADRTWSCFMELDGKTFRENAIPWRGWPDGFLAALEPASGGVEATVSDVGAEEPGRTTPQSGEALASSAPTPAPVATDRVEALVKAAAQDAREVFEDYGSKAREAIDYMEQVALAAYRGEKP